MEPSHKGPAMAPSDVQKYRPRLLSLRQRLQSDVASVENAIPEKVNRPGENSRVPTHPADRDVTGLDEDIAAAQVGTEALQAIEAALERLDAGRYGRCEECGGAISDERLDAIPYTPYCIDCARRME